MRNNNFTLLTTPTMTLGIPRMTSTIQQSSGETRKQGETKQKGGKNLEIKKLLKTNRVEVK